MSAQLVPIGEFSPVGIRLPEGLSFEDWKLVGERLVRYESATQWALGDWLFYGEWQFGRQYEEALELTGLGYQYLADLKYVAGRFDFSRRHESLSLEHHRAVASLPPAEADKWLKQAEAGSWTRARLRDEVAGSFAAVGSRQREPRREPTPDPPADVAAISITLDPKRAEEWTTAADLRGMALSAWVVTVCDEACEVA